MKFIPIFAIIGVARSTAATSDSSDFTVGQTVTTTSGSVEGHAAPGIPDVSEYLGIPFAQPPVGDLRWAAPQPFNGTSHINATIFGHSCPSNPTITIKALGNYSQYGITDQGAETLVSMLGQENDTFAEDCLTLNVWTKPQTGEAEKAVLFWVYGGGFSTGATDIVAYNGKYIVDFEDVIVVSANYRLNIFGFPGDPNIANNLGLLDQRLAVEWVRDNIKSFGGDPNRITMFGQSAGGGSVDYYSYAWVSDPIVAGFIAESGTALSPNSQASASTSAANWYSASNNLGCGDSTSDPGSVLSCMRSKDWKDIQKAIPAGSLIGPVTGNFGPTVDNTVVFSDYVARSAAGNLIKRPMMIGSTDWEPGLLQPIADALGLNIPKSGWAYLEFSLFTCPTSYRALAGVVNKIPTWRYRYFGNFPNLKLSIEAQDQGAWHGSEIPIIFGTDMDVQNKVARTPEEEEISKYLRGAWTAFAKDPVNGLTKYGFPSYNPFQETLLRLAIYNQTGPNPAYPALYDTGCPVATSLANLLTSL